MESCALLMRCPESPARADCLLNLPVGKTGASIVCWLRQLFTPEPSDFQSHAVNSDPPNRKEAMKTFFWIGISIGFGVLLARICS